VINYLKAAALLAALMALFLLIGIALGGEESIWPALGLSVFAGAYAYFYGPELLIRAYRAREIDRGAAASLLRRVHDLSNIAGITPPRIFVSDNLPPNALAVGRSQSEAIIILTSSLLAIMSEDELIAIIAHEITHIKYYDTLVMTVAVIFTRAIAAIVAPLFLIALFAPRGRAACFTLTAATGIAAGAILYTMLNRSREYAADKSSAVLCGRSDWLISSLQKLNEAKRLCVDPSSETSPHFLSTHPSIESRIQRLHNFSPNIRAVSCSR